ncbi:hypothetical protein LguiB_015078 [Lonicera macranthoides]
MVKIALLCTNASQSESPAYHVLVLSAVLSPEQKDPLGFFTVLPVVTNERQSAKLRITLEQSTARAGVAWWAPGGGAGESPNGEEESESESDSWDRHFVGREMNEEIYI